MAIDILRFVWENTTSFLLRILRIDIFISLTHNEKGCKLVSRKLYRGKA